MSRDLYTHQFSNVPITQGTTISVPDCALNLPGGVFRSSGLNSRERLVFRVRATPSVVLTNTRERTIKKMGTVIYLFDSVEQFAALTDEQITHTSTVLHTVLSQNSGNGYFNPTPFAFGVCHITDANTPKNLYPSGTTAVYSWLTENECGTAVSAQEIKDFIDTLAMQTGVGSVEAVRAPDPDGSVATHVKTVYGESVWWQADVKVLGTPWHSDVRTTAVPEIGSTQADNYVEDAFRIVLKYGGPLRASFVDSLTQTPIFTPLPDRDMSDSYLFDMDTVATD